MASYRIICANRDKLKEILSPLLSLCLGPPWHKCFLIFVCNTKTCLVLCPSLYYVDCLRACLFNLISTVDVMKSSTFGTCHPRHITFYNRRVFSFLHTTKVMMSNSGTILVKKLVMFAGM